MTSMLIEPETVLSFGMFKGVKAESVVRIKPSYLIWLDHNTKHKVAATLLDEAKARCPRRIRYFEGDTDDESEDWGFYDDFGNN